jgi:catechol 2,3-dioxygenase-like lactoylglutathione lyase family enzyme
MNFTSVRVITDDVPRLASFYETVLGVPATWATPDFAELVMPGFTLALGHSRTMALFGAPAAVADGNRSAIVEFRVDDVESEFERLGPQVADVVQAPTTMPWGNRSLLLRDPDGTLVNLYTPVSPSPRPGR